MTRPKLGILLSTPPDNKNLHTVTSLLRVALSRQVSTYLYLIDDGVENIDHPELDSLQKKGLKLFVCAYGAKSRGICLSDKAVFCGLVALSDLIKGCERFVTFN